MVMFMLLRICYKDMMMLAMLYNSHQSLEEMNQYIQMIEG